MIVIINNFRVSTTMKNVNNIKKCAHEIVDLNTYLQCIDLCKLNIEHIPLFSILLLYE